MILDVGLAIFATYIVILLGFSDLRRGFSDLSDVYSDLTRV